MGLKIEVRNGNVEQAMRILKKKLLKEGVFQLLKMRWNSEPFLQKMSKTFDA